MREPQGSLAPDKARRPGAIDASIGHRMRFRRLVLGMSQEQLGEALGVTFQQVAKYEGGINRVGACRLWDISLVLDVPVSYFFQDASPDPASGSGLKPSRRKDRTPDASVTLASQATGRRESLDLLEAYNKLTDPVVRRNVFILVQSMCSVRPEA